MDLVEIEQRYDQHKQLSYEFPHRDAPCWPLYRHSGKCDCHADADMEWLITEVKRLQGQIES